MKVIGMAVLLAAGLFAGGAQVLALEDNSLELSASLDSGAYMQDTPVMLSIVLRNEGRDTLKVLSHVATHEMHLDWFEVHLKPRDTCSLPSQAGKARSIRLTDERDKSAPVTKILRNSDFIRHEVNLQTWALRQINGKKLIETGCYDLEVTYEVQGQKDVWNGALRSAPVELVIMPRP